MTIQKIGRYEIKGELGRGGMAAVFDAYDPKIDRRVALKVLPEAFMHDPQFYGRFELEAKAAAALEHKAIVPVYDYGQADNQLYIAMRYLGGGTLAERIENPNVAMSLAEVAVMLDRIAPAIDFAHGRKMLHRDIKPGNILFDEEGRAYLADFGLVKMLEGSKDLTGSGMVGTPEYLAPEMTQEQRLTKMVDMYALGATLYETVTGEPPYDADSPMGILIAHVTEPVPDPRDRNPDLPKALSHVIMRSLAKRPERRFPSAVAMAKDFRAAVEGRRLSFKPRNYDEDTRVLPREDAPAPPPPLRRRRRSRVLPALIWMTAAAIVILTTVWILSLRNRNREAEVAPVDTPVAENVEQEAVVTQAPPTDAPPPTDRPPSTAVPAAPDAGGGLIVYQTNRDGDDDLWALALDTLEVSPLLESDGIGESLPAWSPDGSRIAYVSDENGRTDIYVMAADGSDRRQLTTHGASDSAPTWSPDGTQIAFASDRDGDWDIYMMNTDGSDQRPVIDSPYDDLGPSWSPDGLIAFYSRRAGNADIYVMTVGGVLRGALTDDLSDDFSPVWSPDGSQIAFTSPRDGDWDIYLMDADGSNERKLTSNAAYDASPAWSPDGKWVLFSSGRLGRQSLHRIRPDGTGEEVLIQPGDHYFDFGAWRP